MVTPFAWSQPHPVNDHVAGAAAELRRRGHEVVVLAPSSRATELAAGRRALKRLGREGTPLEGVVALGPAVPVSRRSSLGVPIGVRANLELALTRDRFDVVHVARAGRPEPLLPRASRRARPRSRHLPLARAARLPAGEEAAREAARPRRRPDRHERRDRRAAAAARSPGDYRLLPLGVDLERFRARADRASASWSSGGPTSCRTAPGASSARSRRFPAGSSSSCGRGRSPAGRTSPARCAGRVVVRTALDARTRAAELAGAAGFVPRGAGSVAPRASRRRPRACPLVDPPGVARAARARRRGARAARRGRGLAGAELGRGAPRGRSRRASSASPTSWSGSTAPSCASGGRAPGSAADPLARPPVDPRRPAHAHRALARLRRPGRATCSTTPSGSASARSRSPTTTSSRAPRRRSSSRADARSPSSRARR